MKPSELIISKIDELGPEEAANFFGVSKLTVSNWKAGKTNPPLSAFEAIMPEIDNGSTAVVQTEWEGRNVIILLPVYRTFNADTHYTLFANYAQYGPSKMGLILEKATVIHECRNILAHKFLRDTDAEWAVMVDDDMILPTGNPGLINGRYGGGVVGEAAKAMAFSRLLSHPKSAGIVGGLYFGRHPRGRAQNSIGFERDSSNDEFRRGQHKGLMQCNWVGTGLIRFHRDHLIAINKAIDEGQWPESKPVKEGHWYGPFTPIKTGVGEDVSFCMRAKKLGIPVNLDASLVCLHVGESFYGPSNTK